ncbi:MAG: hypothetical protein QOG75_3256 [Mycobacterium sp.]|nr:hypothetical protein [Mycobacterium sp.]
MACEKTVGLPCRTTRAQGRGSVLVSARTRLLFAVRRRSKNPLRLAETTENSGPCRISTVHAHPTVASKNLFANKRRSTARRWRPPGPCRRPEFWMPRFLFPGTCRSSTASGLEGVPRGRVLPGESPFWCRIHRFLGAQSRSVQTDVVAASSSVGQKLVSLRLANLRAAERSSQLPAT